MRSNIGGAPYEKQEARSKKQEEDFSVQLVIFWLLTIVSGRF
jgi:hypothetical protein